MMESYLRSDGDRRKMTQSYVGLSERWDGERKGKEKKKREIYRLKAEANFRRFFTAYECTRFDFQYVHDQPTSLMRGEESLYFPFHCLLSTRSLYSLHHNLHHATPLNPTNCPSLPFLHISGHLSTKAKYKNGRTNNIFVYKITILIS